MKTLLNLFGRKPPASPAPAPAEEGHGNPLAACRPEEFRLQVADFIGRIPPGFLKAVPHDLSATLRFELADLAKAISGGLTNVPLADIAKQVPHEFANPRQLTQAITICFPWRKLLGAIKEAQHNNNSAGMDAHALQRLKQEVRGLSCPEDHGPA